ncbi:pentapeptide repeat-containing protein [bacterium]|nr:pentapeptide repeat-containing protein [bacterium]MBU1882886.1 pentapeptide repeat-containing protein [bacterium]
MHICTVCEQEFKEELSFDTEQSKCILHCDKSEDNGWFHIDSDGKKQWDNRKVNLFWKYIQNELDGMYEHSFWDTLEEELVYSGVIFPSFQLDIPYDSNVDNVMDLGTNFYSFNVFDHPRDGRIEGLNTIFNQIEITFDQCKFLDDANFSQYLLTEPLQFNHCEFEGSLFLHSEYKNRISFLNCQIKDLRAENIIFYEKVKIKECMVENINLYNTRFKDLCDFYKTTFTNVNFNKTNFEDISVFTEVKFNNDVNFQYTTFSELVLFRKTEFKKTVDFEDSIFKKEANFLNMKAKMANRETARIIKHTFEKQNNIIEANRFYALEMLKRQQELGWKNPFEWFVFTIHNLSSDHSQNWVMALSWIFAIGFLYTSGLDAVIYIFYISIFVTVNVLIDNYLSQSPFIHKIVQNTMILLMLTTLYAYIIWILPYVLPEDFFNSLAKNLNPFSTKPSEGDVTFSFIIYKVIISYLIYQFIISIRQNTRRK